MLWNAFVVVLTVALMEVFSIVAHKYIMHGFGWGWHRSHHEPRAGRFERNDLYGLVFAGISMLVFAVLGRSWPPGWWIGAGMAGYGLLYVLMHDGLVHRRFPLPASARRGYLKRLVQAHRLHHAVRSREGAVSFGFLYAPPVTRLRHRLRQQGPKS